MLYEVCGIDKSKKWCKDQESIQSSTTTEPAYQYPFFNNLAVKNRILLLKSQTLEHVTQKNNLRNKYIIGREGRNISTKKLTISELESSWLSYFRWNYATYYRQTQV